MKLEKCPKCGMVVYVYIYPYSVELKCETCEFDENISHAELLKFVICREKSSLYLALFQEFSKALQDCGCLMKSIERVKKIKKKKLKPYSDLKEGTKIEIITTSRPPKYFRPGITAVVIWVNSQGVACLRSEDNKRRFIFLKNYQYKICGDLDE